MVKEKTWLYRVVFKISYHVTFIYYFIKGLFKRATENVVDED